MLARVRLTSLTGRALKVFALVDPAPGDDGNDDVGISLGSELVAHDDTVASAVAARPALRRTTSGYAGAASDPWTDLQDGDLDAADDATAPGNVVQAARTPLTGRARPPGDDAGDRLRRRPGRPRAAAAAASLRPAVRPHAGALRARLGVATCAPSSSRRRRCAATRSCASSTGQSLLVLAASEDKRHRGASIASPSMPWVWGTLKLENGSRPSGPYHLVWPRDLYHVATAQKVGGRRRRRAAGCSTTCGSVQKPDGSFWQNTFVDGTEKWTGQQLDETALPIVLSWWLGRRGAADWTHVRAAADYLVANGPDSDQERWENQSGYSPNTIATEIAGADLRRRHRPRATATRRARRATRRRRTRSRGTSRRGRRPPTARTATKPYYLRLTKDGNPNDGSTYDLGDNHSALVDERQIVDQSFLGLVLFGAKRYDDPVVRNSLAVGDKVLKADTANGPIWHRFTFDGYGETRDGGMWDLFDVKQNQTLGRAWPLLTGERGEYELLAGRSANRYLRTIGATANDGLMLPEQVWDGRPPTGKPGFASGEGTLLGDAAGVDARRSSSGSRGRSAAARRSSGRASSLGATRAAARAGRPSSGCTARTAPAGSRRCWRRRARPV